LYDIEARYGDIVSIDQACSYLLEQSLTDRAG
jgi:hypothetical protein